MGFYFRLWPDRFCSTSDQLGLHLETNLARPILDSYSFRICRIRFDLFHYRMDAVECTLPLHKLCTVWDCHGDHCFWPLEPRLLVKAGFRSFDHLVGFHSAV